jgi:ATP-dependent RNA helicase DeaD
MTSTFNEFGLRRELLSAIAELGFLEPTPIQSEVIPLMLADQDVIGQAQTGTGKTAAFALPILQNLIPDQIAPQALVLTPTRELALQVTVAFREYACFQDVGVVSVYGGQSYSPQIKAIKRGVDIVVGTPGRLLDLIRRKVLDLGSVRTLILDEADEMLSMGFIDDIESILKETPQNRQTALFSATIPNEIRKLAQKYMNDPKLVHIEKDQITVKAIEQRYYLVNLEDKFATLTRFFEIEEITCALIFTRTRAASADLAHQLAARGFLAEALNGDLSQDAREHVMRRFRSGQIHVLVATDVAARGLDVDDISHVFNFDLPDDPEIYVHRIGRTGRAGKSGIAISIVPPSGMNRLRSIESFTHQKIKKAEIPTREEILQGREVRLLDQIEVWLKRGRCQREREIVLELVESGHDPVEIAAVALKIARAEEKQRPIQEIGEVRQETKRRSRQPNRKGKQRFQRSSSRNRGAHIVDTTFSHEAGMVRLVLSKGKAHGVNPGEVVSTIAYHADIPGSQIGKIQIQPQHTLIDVPEKFCEQVIANASNYRLRKQTLTVTRSG